MKKKITRPDGTIVEYEGTAEELRQLEEELSDDPRKDENVGKGKRLLTEEEGMRLIEEVQKALRQHERAHPHAWWQIQPYWQEYHGVERYPEPYKIWYTTSDQTNSPTPENGHTIFINSNDTKLITN